MAIIWHHACISHSCVYYSSVMWIGACSRGPASAASACRPEQLLLSARESELGSTLLTGVRSMKPPSFSPYRAFGKSCTSLSIPFPPLKYFLLRWYRDTAGRPTWMMFMSSPEAQGCPWNACHSRSSFCCVLAKCVASFSNLALFVVGITRAFTAA